MNSRRSLSFVKTAALALAIPVLSITGLAGGGASAPGSPSEMLASHASSFGPMNLSGVSLANFGVVDGHIYRGEQPKGQDYADLARIGVKTVIDLREDARGSSRAEAEAAGLKYINIPVVDRGQPTDAQVAEFIKDVNDPSTGVCYVHCAGGRHRTGSMIAVYRMTQDGWNLDKAYQEMLAYDFYTRNGHEGFKTYVDDYYQRMTTNPASVPVAYHAPSAQTVTAVATTSPSN